ncbi:MAG: cupin domain-containing protein [Gammaproteobacteria bacterium]|nr:cupin domain-containing protein [Gammaproteobacteria bacterium]
MKVIAVKNEASVTVPAENFTGSARVTMVVKGEDPSNLSCGYVEFQPGARSNWHTHPKGQLLIVTDGEGRIQEWRKPVQVIKPGDVVWTPPGVKHWHGASPTSSMTHAAVTETLDGKSVQWMEHVTDEQYKAQAK